jgi:hypothetical protein
MSASITRYSGTAPAYAGLAAGRDSALWWTPASSRPALRGADWATAQMSTQTPDSTGPAIQPLRRPSRSGRRGPPSSHPRSAARRGTRCGSQPPPGASPSSISAWRTQVRTDSTP